MARIAMGTSANAVMKITGIRSPRATKVSKRSSPLVPGMRISKIRQPGEPGEKSRRKSAADEKTSTWSPTVFINQRSESSMSGSSSTMYTMGSCIIDPGGWKRDTNRRPQSGSRLDVDPAMMGFHNSPADRQPHALSSSTRAEIGVENFPQAFGRNSLPVVGHAEFDGF